MPAAGAGESVDQSEEIADVDLGTDGSGTDRSFGTGRFDVLYEYKFSKTASFSEEASFTESFKDSDDWRFADTASVTAGLTTVLSLKVSYNVQTLNEPVPGKKKTDTVTSAALVAKF